MPILLLVLMGKNKTFRRSSIEFFFSSYSSVRTAMMKTERINFTQEYLELFYMEIDIPPKDGQV
jgi:hypothetical protein